MGGEEDVSVEFVPDPEAEEVGVRGAGVVELVGEDMNGKAGRESQTPSPPNPEEGDQPEDEGQFIGVQEEKVLPRKFNEATLKEGVLHIMVPSKSVIMLQLKKRS